MISFTDSHVENYLYAMLPPREPVLQEMERQANQRDIPIVGPAVARLFYQYAKLINAKTGSRWARRSATPPLVGQAVGEGGKVHYTDGCRKNADEAQRYFRQAGVADRIEVHVGDALELLSERKEQFDILFCDVDKHDYPRVFNMAAARVRQVGCITDNTLWSGRVAYAAGNPDLPKAAPDKHTQGVVEFNRLLYSVSGLVHDDHSLARWRLSRDASLSRRWGSTASAIIRKLG